MATLHFDGDNDWVRGNAVGPMNDAFTYAAIIDGSGTGGFRALIGVHTASLMSWEIYLTSTHFLTFYSDNTGNILTGSQLNDTDDWLVVLTRPTGASVTPRWHVKNLTTGAAWSHSNASGANTNNPRDATGGYFKIGNFDNTPGNPGSADDDFEGDIGLVGFWDGVNMSDGQVEALAANLKTSDWHNHAAGEPTLLTELTSTTPIDIGSAVISLAVTGATATGTDPPSWTFDGGGYRVRGFDGASDQIILDDGGIGNINQALTFVALIQTDEVGGSDRAILSLGTAGEGITMGRQGDSIKYYDEDEIISPPVSMGMAVDTWYVAAMSKGAGADAPRFHVKQLGAGSWVHTTAASTPTMNSVVADRVSIGAFTDGAADFSGRIAVAALFTSELSDGDIESIETNASTDFLASLSPFALWDLNQASVADDVLDLIGTAHETSVTGTTVVTDAGPAGWTFGLEEEPTPASIIFVTRRGR